MNQTNKHLLMFALLVVAGWTVAAALPTKMLTKAEAEAISYSWTDADGGTHDVNLGQTATNAYWIYDMIREVYTNPAVPGIWQATYEGPGYSSSYYTSFDAGLTDRPGTAYYLTDPNNATRGRSVYYGAIGEGWDISGSSDTQYKSTEEGYTMLFVALKDSYADYCTAARLASKPYFSTKADVIELIENTIDSVFVVTEGIRVNEGTTNAGAVFNVKGYFNRFFFMTKGRANDITYGQGQYSTWRSAATSLTGASYYPAADEHYGTMPLFNQMFEQFSPNDATIDTESGYSDLTDFYSSMVAGSTYDVKHDCNSVPYQHHAFSMAGASANTHYTIAGLNIFIPDRRLETWYQQSLTSSGTSWVWNVASSNASSYVTKILDGRTRWDVALWGATSDSYTYTNRSPYWQYDSELGMYFTYDSTYTGEYPIQNTASTKYYFYNPKHYPKMNLYTVKLTAEAVPSTTAGMYTVNLNWSSSFNVLVSDVPQKYWIYVVNADGTYTLLTTTTDVTNYSYEVPMGSPYSYTINYIVMAQPVDAQGNVMFTETWSNEDDVEIPGTTTNERFRLVLVDNISQYTTAGEKNNYNNKLRLYNIGITASQLNDGDNNFVFHRVDSAGVTTDFATLNYFKGGAAILVSTNDITLTGSSSSTFAVNTTGMSGTVTLTASTGFTVSPASFTADGNDHTITVTHSGSATTGTITISGNDAASQVINLTYSSSASISTINYGSMSGTSLSSSTDTNGSWSYTGTYGLSGTISGVNYMYFSADGSAVYTLNSGVDAGKVDVTIVTQSGNYGTGNLVVNGVTQNVTATSTTWSDVAVANGTITITCPSGSNGYPGSYSHRIRSITITRHIATSSNATTGAVVIKPAISYLTSNSENNTALNFTARPFANADTAWMSTAIDYVNDVFSVSTARNEHSPYYNYYVTYENGNTQGGGDEPQPGGDDHTVGDVVGSLDLSTLSSVSGAYQSLSDYSYPNWTGGIFKNNTSCFIQYSNPLTFTVPSGYSNDIFTIAITTFNDSSYGAGNFLINGTSYSANYGSTNYYVISNVSSGDQITISGNTFVSGSTYKPYLDTTSTIYIYYGNYSGN